MVESDALVNGVLSFVIPGLGQAIEGYKVRTAALHGEKYVYIILQDHESGILLLL